MIGAISQLLPLLLDAFLLPLARWWTRLWVRLYAIGLGHDRRQERLDRAEEWYCDLECDLREQGYSPAARGLWILGDWVRGLSGDLSWSWTVRLPGLADWSLAVMAHKPTQRLVDTYMHSV